MKITLVDDVKEEIDKKFFRYGKRKFEEQDSDDS